MREGEFPCKWSLVCIWPKDPRVVALFKLIAGLREGTSAPIKKLKGAAKAIAMGNPRVKTNKKQDEEQDEEESEAEEDEQDPETEGDQKDPETITPSPKKPRVLKIMPEKTTPPKGSPCRRFTKKRSDEDEVLVISTKPSREREELDLLLAQIAAVESRQESDIQWFAEFSCAV